MQPGTFCAIAKNLLALTAAASWSAAARSVAARQEATSEGAETAVRTATSASVTASSAVPKPAAFSLRIRSGTMPPPSPPRKGRWLHRVQGRDQTGSGPCVRAGLSRAARSRERRRHDEPRRRAEPGVCGQERRAGHGLDERIPPGDRHRGGATATAKEREGEQRQVVVPRDRRAAAGTRRTGTPETPALGQAHDHDVQEAADGQAEETDGGERRGGRGLRERPEHHLTTS